MENHTGTIARFASRRRLELIGAALLAAILSVVIQSLPKMDLLQAAINDDNFTDLVQRTRGELSIDTNIRVVTYDASIFDSTDMVDRSLLAIELASLMQLEPRAVGVDFLIDSLRASAPENDSMLAGIIADHPNLIFGIFHEDSLDRFDIPPPFFNLPDRQLGCINLMPEEDNTIRTYTPIWGEGEPRAFESLDLRLARLADSAAAAHLMSFSNGEFIIDYAAGIGETKHERSTGDQIFPVFPLAKIFEIVSSGDSAQAAALRAQFANKTVLVGYGDLRQSQVTSVVDRFYTPFKPSENSLPDMHGVAIHANILNTILKRRVVAQTPLWANIIWGGAMILVLLAGRERIKRVKSPARRGALTYAGFAVLFLLGALLPVLAFRYTPYKFSIFIPISGSLLAVPTLEGLRRAIDLIHDIRRRRRLRGNLPEPLRSDMAWILKAWSPDVRMERAIHFLQRRWHGACAVLFAEAIAGRLPGFARAAIASPTPARVMGAIRMVRDGGATIDARARRAILILEALDAEPVLRRTLRFSRSLYIAMNEIRRQSMEAESDRNVDAEDGGRKELEESVASYADLAIKALEEREAGETKDRFDELYAALERHAARAAEIAHAADGTRMDVQLNVHPSAQAARGEQSPDDSLPPFAFTSCCRLHGADERFIYFGEQEDANSRDDFFDLVYMGRTIRCQPATHPGLTRFREEIAGEEGDCGD